MKLWTFHAVFLYTDVTSYFILTAPTKQVFLFFTTEHNYLVVSIFFVVIISKKDRGYAACL